MTAIDEKIRRQKFTLIELIIVVIICIVMFLFMLVLRRSRTHTFCVNNLKQIGLALRMYSYVYDSNFPDKGGRMGLQMLATEGFLEDTHCYVCPQSIDIILNSSDISLNASYAYAGGLTEAFSVDSALVSDRRNNHDKYGNILFIDGHVQGYAGVQWSSHHGGTNLQDF